MDVTKNAYLPFIELNRIQPIRRHRMRANRAITCHFIRHFLVILSRLGGPIRRVVMPQLQR